MIPEAIFHTKRADRQLTGLIGGQGGRMKTLCFDRWYCDREYAAQVAEELKRQAGCYIVGLVECPEGSWGVLYISGPDWEPDWHLVTADPRIVNDIRYEREGGGS